ncbi:RNA polymerase sigma factor FliA [Aliikangiella coralliicola]|uniref:RNA polymerase sigma factor FliA n=1 Tax=Aliikangiella coralliicola TaxID=2592383 RepID=A0A545UB44_9GAMM|nr:RNA polymerase sigma factor FliA [Aliikangiella coralliicola]TQV86696.1 RNA polymerase sigma factor FliA [Aliikangiella coralliicola]
MAGADTYSQVQQDDFAARYAPLVKRIAHHLLARLPASVQLEDLFQAGMLGLLEARSNFDASKGASFETFAGIRIRGSMIDEIRRGDWVPRSVHKNSRSIASAIKEIEQKTGRDARDTEVAEKLGVEVEDYRQMLMEVSSGHMLDFEGLGVTEDYFSEGLSDSSLTPLERIQKEDFRNSLAGAIASLPEREKLVLALYYDEELNLKEIGEVLGVSESRISQINSQAMLRLQSRLKDWKK